jgi:uncharacterized damage-inducible protein DinB
MSTIACTLEIMHANRQRTLATLDAALAAGGEQVLGWRPGSGRAHIAWQLVHVGITEELFATERLLGSVPAYSELVPRFKGGSTPDDDVPSVETIRTLLAETREHLVGTLAQFTDSDLDVIPESFRERGWSLGKIVQVLAWHEPHHQGQAHLTLNLWRAANA